MAVNVCSRPTPALPSSPLQPPPAAIVLYEPPVTLTPPLPVFAQLRDVGQLNITKPEVAYLLATLCRASYAPTGMQFTQAAQAAFGPGATVTFVPNSVASVPGYGIVITPSGSGLVVISGTTNINQWLEQTLLGNLVATNFNSGDSGMALATYISASQTISTALLALAAADQDVLITGHSMGGAVGAVLQYQQYRGLRTGETRLVQFAAPKAGNSVLAGGVPSSSLALGRYAIQGDVIPALPPDPTQFAKVFVLSLPLAVQSVLNFWTEFKTPNAGLNYIGQDGSFSFGDEPGLLFNVTTAVLQAAAAQPISVVSNHLMKAFCDNILQGLSSLQPLIEQGWSTPSLLVAINNTLENMGL